MWHYFWAHQVYHFARLCPKHRTRKCPLVILLLLLSVSTFAPQLYVIVVPEFYLRFCPYPVHSLMAIQIVLSLVMLGFCILFVMMETAIQQVKLAFHVFGVVDFLFGIAFVTYTFISFSCIAEPISVYSVYLLTAGGTLVAFGYFLVLIPLWLCNVFVSKGFLVDTSTKNKPEEDKSLCNGINKVTTEKLEELKGNIPRAGPKYRLGMYFETIHGVSDFEDVYTPSEDGYTSYWETDTEVDTELNNFIFSNVTGDSASVICIDEAVDVLAVREQRIQEQALMQERAQMQAEELPILSPQDEHMLERSNESKRSSASRQSRRSHNSGSDGMYDEPPPLPPRRVSTCTDTTGTSAEDHTYETLDDCQEDYKAAFLSKDERQSPVNKDEGDSDSSGKGRTRSPLLAFTKHRSNSTPTVTEGPKHRHRRQLSDSNAIDFAQRKRRSDKVSPKGVYPPPVKGYSFPSGIPEEYADYMAAPTTDKRLHEAEPTSPERSAQVKSPERRNSKGKVQRSPSLIIKHKGKTFLIPVVDKKLQQKLEKVKGPPKTPLYATVMKPSNANTGLTRSNSDAYSSGAHKTSNLIHSVRSHVSPPKTLETQEHSKSKSKRHSQTVVSKQVTHYGVL